MKFSDRIKSPEQLIVLGLGLWWVINLLQAGLTELANDEAYYRMFADHLGWGYFDHPPMTALLVWLGKWIGGELGVRFFFTLLQPLYLYVLWRLIRPGEATVRDAGLFLLIASAIPMLQLYGFLAVPDGPLMLFTVLLLGCYKRFSERNDWLSALGMGLCMAALAYSKYQGALVVILLVVSDLRLLRSPKFWAAAGLTGLLILPHLLWQAEHDWVSMRYHLTGRNRSFQWRFVSEYLLNMLAVFNPFLFPVAVAAWWKTRSGTPVLRAMSCIAAGFLVFFFFSTARGHVQPQWVIPAAFGLIAVLFGYVRTRERLRRYTVRVAWITLALVGLTRLEMIFNPLHLRFEIFDNKTTYGQIAAVAQGRPVLFDGSYTRAAKYAFYTGGESFARPTLWWRSSHYEFLDDDRRWTGTPVVVEIASRIPASGTRTIDLANGQRFTYRIDSAYRPLRGIRITGARWPASAHVGDMLQLDLILENPYPATYVFGPETGQVQVGLVLQNPKQRSTQLFPLEGIGGTLPAKGTMTVRTAVPVPPIGKGEYTMGLTLFDSPASTWYNAPVSKLKIE